MITEEVKAKIKEYSRREDDTEESEGYDLGLIDHILWFLDSVWRSSKDEKPKDGRRVLLIEDKTLLNVGTYQESTNWVLSASDNTYVSDSTKWCYIEDLLPEN